MNIAPTALVGTPKVHAISAVVILAIIRQVTALTMCLVFVTTMFHPGF